MLLLLLLLLLMPPRARPTCAHRCSLSARSRRERTFLFSLPGWDPLGGRVHLLLPGAHLSNRFPL